MGKIHLVIPDIHSHPDHNNDRADLLGKLILDLKPDVLVNLGDHWDMPSMASYDKGKAAFYGRSYRRDLDAGLEFQERMFDPIKKAKKRKPYCVFLEGNHEERMKRALSYSPELEGTIGFKDFELEKYYDQIVEYSGTTPGVITIDGIGYAHYFITGVSGRSVSGEHTAHALLTKQFQSSTQGHIHTLDWSVRTAGDNRKVHGLIAGVFQDYDSGWAGEINNKWSRGLVIKREVENGNYDLEWVSMERLKKYYG